MGDFRIFSPSASDGSYHDRQQPATVADVVALYFDNESHRQKPEVLVERKRVLGLFTDEFGRMLISNIRKADVVLWVNRHPKWQSDWTIKRIYATLHRPFEWARKIDLIERNPFAGLSHPRGDRGQVLAPEHYNSLVRGTSAIFRRVLFFLHFTGARPCEMAQLKWEYIDFARGIAILWLHKGTRKQKVKKPRIIVLLPVLLRMLLVMKRYSRSEYVFLNQRGRPWCKNSLGLRIFRLRKKLGLPRSAKLYGTRHAFGTTAVENGVPIKAVAELMGHADSRTTEENYVHINGNVKFLQENAGRVFPKNGKDKH